MKRIYVLFFSLNRPSLNKQASIIFITSIDCISAKSFLSKLGVCVYIRCNVCVYSCGKFCSLSNCVSRCVCVQWGVYILCSF